MKKSIDILGLPIIAILDGKEIGKVTDLVINPKEGRVEYLVAETGVRHSGTKVLAAKDVESFGDDAVVTEKAASLVDMNDAVPLNELLEQDITLKGTKVITRNGKIIGTVTEFHLDEEEMGKIAGLDITPVDGRNDVRVIPASQVVTFGKDAIIVNEQSDSPNPPEKQRVSAAGGEPGAVTDSEGAAATPTEASSGPDERAMSFEERQRQFLIGRKVSKTILSASGEVLIKEGTEITEELIEKVIAANKYPELLMNYAM